jgi:hypothetical protein
MALTKDIIMERLTAAGVPFSTHSHAAVMTAEAQVERRWRAWSAPGAPNSLGLTRSLARPQAEALSGVPGSVTKNLFLKVRRGRRLLLRALLLALCWMPGGAT